VLIEDLKRIFNEIRDLLEGLVLEMTSARLIVLEIAWRSAVVVLEIDRLKPVDALVNNSFAGLAAGSNSETVFITALEVLVAGKATEGVVALECDARPAGLNAEVVVELVEETLGRGITLGVIVPTISGIRNERLAELKTLTASCSRELVAVLTTGKEGDGIRGVGSKDGGKEGGGEGSRVLGASGDVDITLEGTIIETTTAVNLTGPCGFFGTFVVRDSDNDSISVDDLSAEADGLLSIGDSSVIVLFFIAIFERVNDVAVGLDVFVFRELFKDEIVCDGDIGSILRNGDNSKVIVGSTFPIAGRELNTTRSIGSVTALISAT